MTPNPLERSGVFLPFQNVKHPDQGKGWHIFEPFRETFEAAKKAIPLERLTDYTTQTTLFTTVMGMVNTFRQPLEGSGAEIVVGHSFGENISLAQRAVLGEGDEGIINGAKIVLAREDIVEGSHEATEEPKNGMASFSKINPNDKEGVIAIVDNLSRSGWPVYLANDNSPSQIVVTGVRDQLAAAALAVKNAGFMTKFREIPLVRDAYHSPLLREKQEQLREAIHSITGGVMNNPDGKIISPMSQKEITSGADALDWSNNQYIWQVWFTDAIAKLSESGPKALFAFDPSKLYEPIIKENLEFLGWQVLGPEIPEDISEKRVHLLNIDTPESVVRAWRFIQSFYDIDIKIPQAALNLTQ